MANTEVLKEPRGFIKFIEIVSKQCDKYCSPSLLSVEEYACTLMHYSQHHTVY